MYWHSITILDSNKTLKYVHGVSYPVVKSTEEIDTANTEMAELNFSEVKKLKS